MHLFDFGHNENPDDFIVPDQVQLAIEEAGFIVAGLDDLLPFVLMNKGICSDIVVAPKTYNLDGLGLGTFYSANDPHKPQGSNKCIANNHIGARNFPCKMGKKCLILACEKESEVIELFK